MATLVKHRNQYISRIKKLEDGKRKTTTIPLRTNQKDVAVVRHHKVEQSENNIKEGIITKSQFNNYFEWLNDKGTSELRRLTLGEAIGKFLTNHKNNVSFSSIKRLIISMNRLTDVIKSRIGSIDGNECINWENSKKYYEFHRKKHQVN